MISLNVSPYAFKPRGRRNGDRYQKFPPFRPAETVEGLLNYTTGEASSVSLNESLDDATAILEELRNRDFSAARQRAERELEEAERLVERVRGLQFSRTALQETGTRLEELQDRVEDMRQLIQQVLRNVTKVTPGSGSEIDIRDLRVGLAGYPQPSDPSCCPLYTSSSIPRRSM